MTEPTPAPPAADPTVGNGAGTVAVPAVPDVDVTLDLDTLEREGDIRPPFVFRLKGRKYAMVDRQNIDWQDIIHAMRNPISFIKFAMSPADHAHFLAQSVPLWQMEALMERYFKHFGIPLPGEVNGSSGF